MSANINGNSTAICNKLTMFSSFKIYLRHILYIPVPIVLFIYFISLISMTMSGNNVMKNLNWMPHIGMNFNLYVDGLGLLFSLLITGIGSLVVLYSIGS
jgi:NADH:ubiquinone oxidoreductase subunit 5 (subunit L)/multisubunit Na+/H+ antiporter MnhA subunit